MEIHLLDERLPDPRPATEGSAGIDLYACVDSLVVIKAGHTVIIPSGIKVAIPVKRVGLVIPRSSTGIKGLVLANQTGVIDSDYRGEVKIPIYNNSDNPLVIDPMDRIAQMVVVYHYDYANVKVVDFLDETERGEGGFGHTGK